LTAPNGGEFWYPFTTHLITWTTEDLIVANVKLEYSIDNGDNYITIVESVSNTGSYSWNVPNTPSERALVKITAIENPGVSDVSNSTFYLVYEIMARIIQLEQILRDHKLIFINNSGDLEEFLYTL
jgi:hypothetical protein